MELAAEPAVRLDVKGLVEHFLLGRAHVRQWRFGFHIELATGAHGHSAARPFDGQLVALAQFHHVHPHVRGAFELVGNAFAVDDRHADEGIHGGQINRGILRIR